MFLKRAASCVRLSQASNGCAEYAMGVVIHETFSFHYLAAFLAFFFWSVNCTSLVCKLSSYFRHIQKYGAFILEDVW